MSKQKRINLALQGGGSHGAFTWGVLDRLLCEDGLAIEGITGTSAGAMNAVALCSGYLRGGRQGARESLELFWNKIVEHGKYNPIRRNPWDIMSGNYGLEHSIAFRSFEFFTSMFSPYQFNPLNFHPLRAVLNESIDFELVRGSRELKLFVSATNVKTGKAKIFENDKITPEVLLASSCVPSMFKAVEIEGEFYWDGGFVGNPTLFPLIYNCESPDVMIVAINPKRRAELPKSSLEIQDRMHEIGFNAVLAAELRAIEFVSRLIENGQLNSSRYRRLNMHLLEDEADLGALSASTKLLTERDFIFYLRDLGVKAAEGWLGENWEMIGVRSSVDIKEAFL